MDRAINLYGKIANLISKDRLKKGPGVIGGYSVGRGAFDALVYGYYEGPKLMYGARTRNGFTATVAGGFDEAVSRAGNERLPFR